MNDRRPQFNGEAIYVHPQNLGINVLQSCPLASKNSQHKKDSTDSVSSSHSMIDSLVVVVRISLNVHLHGHVWKTFSPRSTKISQHHFKRALYNDQTSRVVTPNGGLVVRVHPSQNGRKHSGFPGFMKHKLPTFITFSVRHSITLSMPMAGPKLHSGGENSGFSGCGSLGFWDWKSNFWQKHRLNPHSLEEIISKCHGWKVVM